jgi:hypothetical protein
MRASVPGLGAAAALVYLSGCGLLTEPFGADAPDVRGRWVMTGTQSSPSLSLSGSLVIANQQGGEISGSASWEESDGVGAPRPDGGQLNGRVLSPEDLDFDITLLSGERRMIARLVADTMTGTWVQPLAGRNGDFRAVRTGPQ